VYRVCRVFLMCQTRLKLSCTMNECKPLPAKQTDAKATAASTRPKY
jgi:hypothetical protein